MGKVGAYHTKLAEMFPKYHTYNDCPAGKRVIEDDNNVDGVRGELCHFCSRMTLRGTF